jgi:hypothetical protein
MKQRLSAACRGESLLFLSKGVVEKPQISGLLKMLRCKARKKRTARRIFTYVGWCGLQRNTADERFSKIFRILPAWNIIIILLRFPRGNALPVNSPEYLFFCLAADFQY